MNIIKKTRDREQKTMFSIFVVKILFFSVACSIIWHIKVIPIDSFATNRTHVYKSPRAFETNTTTWFTHYLIFSFNFRNIGFVSSSTNNTLCVRTHFIFFFLLLLFLGPSWLNWMFDRFTCEFIVQTVNTVRFFFILFHYLSEFLEVI